MDRKITIEFLKSLGLIKMNIPGYTDTVYEYFEGDFEDEIIVKYTIYSNAKNHYGIYIYNRGTGKKFDQNCFYEPVIEDLYNALIACNVYSLSNKIKMICK